MGGPLGALKEQLYMSIGHDIPSDSTVGHFPLAQVPLLSRKTPLHRVADVRRRLGISVHSVARRMHTAVDEVRRQEDPANDLLISELLNWQQALDVPMSDLLVKSDGLLTEPLTRTRLLRIMKTVRALNETATSSPIQRFATMLEQQLLELMPELKGVIARGACAEPSKSSS